MTASRKEFKKAMQKGVKAYFSRKPKADRPLYREGIWNHGTLGQTRAATTASVLSKLDDEVSSEDWCTVLALADAIYSPSLPRKLYPLIPLFWLLNVKPTRSSSLASDIADCMIQGKSTSTTVSPGMGAPSFTQSSNLSSTVFTKKNLYAVEKNNLYRTIGAGNGVAVSWTISNSTGMVRDLVKKEVLHVSEEDRMTVHRRSQEHQASFKL